MKANQLNKKLENKITTKFVFDNFHNAPLETMLKIDDIDGLNDPFIAYKDYAEVMVRDDVATQLVLLCVTLGSVSVTDSVIYFEPNVE